MRHIFATHRGIPGFVLTLLLLFPPAQSRADDECLECHASGADIVDEVRYEVDVETWLSSVHVDVGFSCSDCHQGKGDYPHEEDSEPASCGDCHDEATAEFEASIHAGKQRERQGDSPWPSGDPCSACHGVHDVRAVDDPGSRVFFRNIPATCGTCHADLSVVRPEGLNTSPADNYQASVHGLKLKENGSKPAVCTDCHGYHRVLKGNHAESHINPFKIPTTCGQCHEEESEEYVSSVHGKAFDRGVSSAPTCTGCHGIHTIKMVPHEDLPEAQARLVRTTCVACHSSEALMGEYGVLASRVKTYRASYHGLANKRGNTAVADCASCHGIHAIYPSSDPRSSVAPENIQHTCGGCHPGANEQFAKNPVHFVDGDDVGQPDDVVYATWVKRFYWVLIIGVVGGMVVHNAIILAYHVRRKIQKQRVEPGRQRFSRSQMMQHSLLLTSFILLAVTGFMLAYPDTWWSQLVAGIGVTESIRRWAHRIAAIVLVGASFYHLAWILVSDHGRLELTRILPGVRDFREMIQNMRFHLGKERSGPAFAKFDYGAKVEYWSLIWGTVIMAITGIVLWFPVWTTSFLPGWIVKVSEVIHLFEAWLATLAILVFHLFYVVAHPEVYPISLSMFNGRMPEEEARQMHPMWLPDGDPEDVEPVDAESAGTERPPAPSPRREREDEVETVG